MWWIEYFYIQSSESGMIPFDFSLLKEDKKFITIVQNLQIERYDVLRQMKLCKNETQKGLQLIMDELDDDDQS